MRYDISKASVPKMPNLGKDRKHIKNLLKMPQKQGINPSFRCFFLILKAHFPVGKNQPKDLVWKDFCTKQPLSHAKMALLTR